MYRLEKLWPIFKNGTEKPANEKVVPDANPRLGTRLYLFPVVGRDRTLSNPSTLISMGESSLTNMYLDTEH